MDKVNAWMKDNPFFGPLAVAGGALVAYHNGWLNFFFKSPSKAGIAAKKKKAGSDSTAGTGATVGGEEE